MQEAWNGKIKGGVKKFTLIFQAPVNTSTVVVWEESCHNSWSKTTSYVIEIISRIPNK